MSVLRCSRAKCENIMCDNLICGEYICHECLEEFEEFAKHQNNDQTVMIEKKWNLLFNKFMNTEKIEGSNILMNFKEFTKKNRY